MGYTGPPGPIPIPPSESSPKELYKERFLDTVTSTERPAPEQGSWKVAIVAFFVVAAVVAGVVAYYFLAGGPVRIVVSDVSLTPGTCQSYPDGSYSWSTLTYHFTVTNVGSRSALAALEFYANGQLVDSVFNVSVSAGQSVPMAHLVEVGFCNPTSGKVAVESATVA